MCADAAAALLLGALTPRRAVCVWSLASVVTALAWAAQGRNFATCALGGTAMGWCVLNAAIDSRTMLLIPMWSHAAALMWCVQAGILIGTGGILAVMQAAACAGGVSLWMAGLALTAPRSLGRGDVRLIAVLSAWVALLDAEQLAVLDTLARLALFLGLAFTLQLLGFATRRLARLMRSRQIHSAEPTAEKKPTEKKPTAGKRRRTSGEKNSAGHLALPFGPALVCGAWITCAIACGI